jgi:hypothetical protein
MKLELSQVIDRPPAEVFRFIATNHVQNHPRWIRRWSSGS